MIDPNMKSTIYIKNIVQYFPIAATPVLVPVLASCYEGYERREQGCWEKS